MATKVNVGIIGTGIISKAYINGCRKFDILEIVVLQKVLSRKKEPVITAQEP